MANKSLGDMFGDAGRLALGIRNLDVQEEQNRLYEERSHNNAKNDQLNALMKMSDDPVIRANHDQLDGVLLLAGKIAEVPEISRESLKASRTYMNQMYKDLGSGKFEEAKNGIAKAFITFKTDDADRMIKSVANAPVLHEQLLSMQEMRKSNRRKFDALDRSVADIDAWERPIADALTQSTVVLQGTDTPDFRSAVKNAKTLQRPDGTSVTDVSALSQSARVKAFSGAMYKAHADTFIAKAKAHLEQANEMATLMEVQRNGGTVPVDMSPYDVAARMDASKMLGGAYTALGQWAQDPFNGEKLKAAKAAEKTIVLKRAEIEELKKTEASTRTEIAQDSLTFRQDKEGLKNAQLMATNRATNEFSQLPPEQRTPQSAGKLAEKHSTSLFTVGAQDVLLGGKDPNRPLTEVKVYNEKPSVAEAGKIASLEQSFTEMGMVRERLIHDDGTVDRGALVTAALNLPFTKGRDINMFVSKAVEIKLRAATGAAAPTHEVTKYTKDFAPSVKDSDELIRYKLDSMEEWLKATADITDPLGSLRERSNKLLSPGTTALLNSPDYKELRSANPRASSMHIMKFLQREQALKRKDR